MQHFCGCGGGGEKAFLSSGCLGNRWQLLVCIHCCAKILVERTASKCLVLLLEVLAFEDVGVFGDGAGEAACCWRWS